MSEEIKRMRYETGLFLTEAEFNLEQQYHMRMRRLHNRRLHTPGIVWGLDLVAHPGTYRIDIQPGLALDVFFDSTLSEELSREIAVPSETTVDLTTANYAPNSSIYLWIQYAEEEADTSVNAAGQSIHWLESFAVGHSLTKPSDEKQNVILGMVLLDDSGKAFSIALEDANGPLRLYAGLMSKSVETDRLILSDDAISESFPYLDGTLFLPDGTPGIEVNSPRTHLTGELLLAGEFRGKEPVATLNDGEQGSGVTGRYAGLRILRGLLDAVRLVYDETDDRWKAGVEGLEETLAFLSDVYTRTQLDAFFPGQSASGRKQVDWADILNKIDAYTKTEINSLFSGQSASGKKQVDWADVINRSLGWYEMAPVGFELWIRTDEPWTRPPAKGTGWIRLKSGLAVSGGYNEGLLTGESVSGSSPLISAYAVIADAASPAHGQQVRLIEDERRFARAGSSGVLQDDQIQQIVGTVLTEVHIEAGTGPFYPLNTGGDGGYHGPGSNPVSLGFDSSRAVRSGSETRGRNIGYSVFKKIR